MPSSVIRSLRYNPNERTLMIDFREGRGLYRYFDVPVTEWKTFRSAPSKGTYLNQVFKEGGYGYERVEPAKTNSSTQSTIGQDETDPELFWGEASDPAPYPYCSSNQESVS